MVITKTRRCFIKENLKWIIHQIHKPVRGQLRRWLKWRWFPLSFGPIQLRLAELFNYLGVFNKRYIWSITLGVAIANTASPLGIIDIVIGSAGTCAVLWIAYFATKNQQNLLIKLMLTAILFALSMFTVAGPLTFFYQLPFWYTWLTVGLGELLSMTVGGILIYVLNKKIQLVKRIEE